MKKGPCMYCGLNPAAGYASVWKDGIESWYCHGDDEDITCYERRSLLAVQDEENK